MNERCTKRGWLTQAKAAKALEAIRRSPTRTRVYPTRAYRCPDCGLWHVTALATWTEAGAKVPPRPTDK